MSNLPDDQTPNIPIAKNPEGQPAGESVPIFETPSTHEQAPSAEINVPIPTPDNTPTSSATPQSVASSKTAPNTAARVVDKTDKITSLHEIKSSTDKLTVEADEEEERFIEEVEKHHGDL